MQISWFQLWIWEVYSVYKYLLLIYLNELVKLKVGALIWYMYHQIKIQLLVWELEKPYWIYANKV